MTHKIVVGEGAVFLTKVPRVEFLNLLGAEVVQEIRNATAVDPEIALFYETVLSESGVFVESEEVTEFLDLLAESEDVPSYTDDENERVKRKKKKPKKPKKPKRPKKPKKPKKPKTQ